MSKKSNKKVKNNKVIKSDKKVSTMRQKIQAVYNSVQLESTCCRQCTCCMVSCPQMNQCEAATILDKIWAEWSDLKRKKFIVKCMNYFFSNSMVKPCPLLGKGSDGVIGCSVYEDRPLNCRVYGQWSNESYEKRVDRFVEATGIERSNLPLNKQCQNVVNKSGKIPSEDEINQMFENLSAIDMVAYGYDKVKVDKKYNYRSLHDWALAKYLGEEKLTILSTFLLACTKEQAEDYLSKFEQVIIGNDDE